MHPRRKELRRAQVADKHCDGGQATEECRASEEVLDGHACDFSHVEIQDAAKESRDAAGRTDMSGNREGVRGDG